MSIMLIGEAYGEQEEREGRPFVGSSGYILNGLLSQVGISRSECHITNVFNLRPQPRNDIMNLCGTKAEGIKGMPALVKGKYALAEYTPELTRLYREINEKNPNIIVALGATAAWAVCGSTGIRAIRGAPCGTTSPASAATGVVLNRTFKVLPTYHPAAVSRDWSLRPIVLSDLDKAKRFSGTPELTRPSRKIWIEPTLGDLRTFHYEHIRNASLLSIDIETKGGQITCIGFAPSPDVGIVVPFYAEPQNGKYLDGNYWPDIKSELEAWSWVRKWCQYPGVFQNGMYDMHVLWRSYGITCNPREDTMLMHHAMQPEMEKGLGFLGSIYTDEPSWKFMRKVDTLKKED